MIWILSEFHYKSLKSEKQTAGRNGAQLSCQLLVFVCSEVVRRFLAVPTGSNNQLLVLHARICQWETSHVFVPKEYDLSLVMEKKKKIQQLR